MLFHISFFHFFSVVSPQNFANNVGPASRSTLRLFASVAAPQDPAFTSEGAFVPAKLLRSEVFDKPLADYEWKYNDCFDVYWFIAMFFKDHNEILYDSCHVKCHKKIVGQNSRWKLI